jgi:hypothetical protein
MVAQGRRPPILQCRFKLSRIPPYEVVLKHYSIKHLSLYYGSHNQHKHFPDPAVTYAHRNRRQLPIMTDIVEAGTVIGLISGVISIVEATKTEYDAIKDAKGQPEAFRQVAARLPLVNEILQSAKERSRTLDESTREALKPTIKSCKAKAEDLKKLFQEVIRKDDDKWYDRYKKAVGTLGKGDKVECLMEGMLKDIQVLACERLIGIATYTQMKELEEAIKEMNEMPPSLPDKARSVIQTHSGSGDNIRYTSPGTITIDKGSGDVYYKAGSVIQIHSGSGDNIGKTVYKGSGDVHYKAGSVIQTHGGSGHNIGNTVYIGSGNVYHNVISGISGGMTIGGKK